MFLTAPKMAGYLYRVTDSVRVFGEERVRIRPEISGASIVLLGNLNPLIFRPSWFEKRGILKPGEVEAAEIEVVHREFVSFTLPWLSIAVDARSFRAVSVQEPHNQVHDFVLNCFARLPETPVTAMGINRDIHFPLPDADRLHRMGDALAPKELWGSFVWGQDGGRQGGMRSVVMEQSPRKDGRPGHLRVKVEPSTRLPTGVFVQVNSHYDLSENNEPSDAAKAAEVLRDD